MKKYLLLAACCFVSASSVCAQGVDYQRPPQAIEEIAFAKLSPLVSFSKDYQWMIQLDREPYYSVEELAQPELRLAGERINPNAYCYTRMRGYTGGKFVRMSDKKEVALSGLPEHSVIMDMLWFPQSPSILLKVKKSDGVWLYRADAETGQITKVSDRKLNETVGVDVAWLNNTDFVVLAVPEGRGPLPERTNVPTGPVVQENLGGKAPVRTYQDLLKDKYDEQVFEYYFTSQMLKITPDGEKEIGKPEIIVALSASPDGTLLLKENVHGPYSYTVPMGAFPSTIEVVDVDGNPVKKMVETPVIVLPTGYDTSSPFPRRFGWRADQPATLYWVEAQDGGDPRQNKVEFMDVVYQQKAPFSDPKQEVGRTRLRFRNIQWCDDAFALLSEFSRATRSVKTYRIEPCSGKEPVTVFDYSTDDLYNHPGIPYMVKNQYDKLVLYTSKNHSELLLLADGASPEGDMPYISRFDLKTGKNTILWRCEAPYFEEVRAVIDPAALKIITGRESQTEPTNYYLRDLKKKTMTALTAFPNPYPSLKGVTKETIRYKRADGVDLTATVYLPEGYDKARDGRLPVLMWAYPREYGSASNAAQVRGSKHAFTMISYGSPVFWVTQGYCVMENVEMPIVGSEGVEPNDNFIEQLVMNAEAAVKVISDMGVGDPDRVAVGGHSYGAFMTANLLTHTNLFKAGIARSGAYNRTLTPFGFQSETRTYWEIPEIYNAMSPFMYADKLSGALLLVHGELDDNMGTFPIQTERLYQALKGHGATVRYVVLPYEAHSYSARENILHLLYEENSWLDQYVKNAGR